MTATIGICPQRDLVPGRYRLDSEGRLHPERFGFISAVALVTVRARSTDDVGAVPSKADAVRADCAAEAAERAAAAQEAKRLTTAHPLPVPERRPDTPTRPMARRAPIPAEPAPVDDEDDEAFADFTARVKAKQAARAKAPMNSEPKIDGKQVAAVHRAMKLGPKPKKAPTRRALTDSECYSCGTRTTIGCDHFLPFLGDAR